MLPIDTIPALGEAGATSIYVPDHLACLPSRARRTGGRFHTHPYWTSTTSIPEPETLSFNATLVGIKSCLVSDRVTFRRKQSTFSYLSVKTMRTQGGEGPHELANGQWKEVDPSWLDYHLQGLGLDWKLSEGGHKTLTLDNLTLSDRGEIVAEEVKASDSYFVEPEYAAIMERVESDLALVGIGLNKVTGDELESVSRHRLNVTTAFNDRFTAFYDREVDAVRNLFAKDGRETAMGRIYECLHDDTRVSPAIANAMMCARHLAYDLSLPVTLDSIVKQPRPAPANLPDIRAIQH